MAGIASEFTAGLIINNAPIKAMSIDKICFIFIFSLKNSHEKIITRSLVQG